ncbi:MAG TPA: nuclear transport factor 2 family protein [Acidimicrobiia bacterium]|nr:nuclear transport factor 2 family protein [Acidimicrobiia bacterium]
MSEQNIDVIRRVYEAMKNRDANVMQELFAEDIHVSQTPLLPWGGEYEGRDGAFTFFLTLVEHIQSQVTVENLFSAGDHVVQTGRTRGTVVANGTTFDVPEAHVWEVRDGKVTAFHAYIDTPAMLEALGR